VVLETTRERSSRRGRESEQRGRRVEKSIKSLVFGIVFPPLMGAATYIWQLRN
jgi:hypothetical protein